MIVTDKDVGDIIIMLVTFLLCRGLGQYIKLVTNIGLAVRNRISDFEGAAKRYGLVKCDLV